MRFSAVYGVLLAPLLLISSPEPARAQTFNASIFFGGLQIGDFWVYRVNNVQDVTFQIVRTEVINGVTTFVSRWTGGPFDGFEGNESFDAITGGELWRTFAPSIFVNGVGFLSQLQEFTPPLLTTLPTIKIGQIVSSQAAVANTFSDGSTAVTLFGTVQSQYRYAFIEPVFVPLGTYAAIQRQIQLDISLEVTPGVFEQVTATTRDWIVPGLGSVRLDFVLPDRTDVFELVNTNRQFAPEPSAILLQTTALSILAGSAAWRSAVWRRKRMA